jgi:hypothetical protein
MIFQTELVWKSLKEHFQIYGWVAEAKHLPDNFSDFCKRFGGVTIFLFLQKKFRTENFC